MGLFAKAESLRDPASHDAEAAEVSARPDSEPPFAAGTEGAAHAPRHGLLSRTRKLASAETSGGPEAAATPPAPPEQSHDTPATRPLRRSRGLLGRSRRLERAAEPAPGPARPPAAPSVDEPSEQTGVEIAAELEPTPPPPAEPPVVPTSQPDAVGFAARTVETVETVEQAEPADLEALAEPASQSAAEPEAASVPVLPLDERLAALASRILDARMGLEAPGVLFTLFQREFGIRRAAILVPDVERSVYTPWASEGLDRTSLRRLRLDLDTVAGLEAGTATGDALAPWVKLFSTRDAAGIDKIHHWPCAADDGVSAVFVAAEMDETLENHPVFRENLPQLLEAAGHALADGRERELSRVQAAVARSVTAPPEQVIGEGLTIAAQHDAVLVRLSLAPLLGAATTAAPSTDRFRLTRDVAQTLAFLTRETAEVVVAGSPEDLYLLFHGVRSPDADLWVHALLLSIESLLPSLGRMPELPTRSIRYPRDGKTALELMAALG